MNKIFNEELILQPQYPIIFICNNYMDVGELYDNGINSVALDSIKLQHRFISIMENNLLLMQKKAFVLVSSKNKINIDSFRNELNNLSIDLTFFEIPEEYHNLAEYKNSNNEEYIKQLNQVITLCQQLVDIHTTELDTINNNLKSGSVKSYIESLQFNKDLKEFRKASEVKTGFNNYDMKTGGLYTGLYVLGALTSLGKTTYCYQLANQLAENGHHVIYFSLEQNTVELVTKSLARLSYNPAIVDGPMGYSAIKIRQGKIKPGITSALANRFCKQVENRLNIIECKYDITMPEITAKVQEYINNNGVKPIVFIDYLQIINSGDIRLTDKQAVDRTIQQLKSMQSKLNLIVIVISSFNRANYLTPVSFNSFKDSGNIEHGADVILGLQYSKVYSDVWGTMKDPEKQKALNEEKNKPIRLITLSCLKNRYGVATFNCDYEYLPEYDLYREKKYNSESERKIKKVF